jgi:hypothetical protein
VAVLTLPLLGEDLGSGLNNKVRRYNAALSEAVAGSGGPKDGALNHPPQLLDLNSEMGAFLRRRPGRSASGAASSASTGWREAVLFSPLVILLQTLVAHFMHGALRLPWSAASRLFGLRLLIDQIHLNEVAGGMVARLVSTSFLDPALALSDFKAR